MTAGDTPMPDVYDAVLDAEELDRLFADLSACVEILAVTVKQRSRALAGDEPMDLDRARRLLAAGTVVGVQVRYRLDGAVWCDTLLRRPDGVRLVRVQVP